VNAIAKQVGLASFEYVIEKLLDIEIDYYALVTFNGFNNLVEQVEPVSLNTKQVKDKKFWDDPLLPRGVYFPAMTNYQLYAWQPSYLASNGRQRVGRTGTSLRNIVTERRLRAQPQDKRFRSSARAGFWRVISASPARSARSSAWQRQTGAGALMTNIHSTAC
jgi:hypothetical protein